MTMADENQGNEPETEAGTITEPAEPTDSGEGVADGDEEKLVLKQVVDVQDAGPCKKHVKVSVDRGEIDKLYNKKIADLVSDAEVPGFRPGKAPRKVIVRRFAKDVEQQVKGQVLLASLEQLAEEQNLNALSPPNLRPDAIEVPKEGPLEYEFDIEVRPEFDLPNYKGLKLKRPVKTFTDAEVEKEELRILSRFGQLIPKPEGNAQVGDYIVADLVSKLGDQELGRSKEAVFRVDDQVAFKDGVAEKFAEQTKGANAGDKRTVDVVLSDAVAAEQLRGQKVQIVLDIKDVKKMRLPDLTHEFLHTFGVHNPEQLRERVRGLMESRLEYEQRQWARDQVLNHIAAAADWELPKDLLMRQARTALSQRVMEMRQAGMSDDDINARSRVLQQDVLQTTAKGLKEHFVLQKIAEVEKIEVTDDEIEAEVEALAERENQSVRRVRAQLEREDMLENLAILVIERKVLDFILDTAEYEDVPLEPEKGVAPVEAQAVAGEMRDPTAAPVEEEKKEEDKS